MVGIRDRAGAFPGALFHPRDGALRGGAALHHIGLYAYRRRALQRFVALPPSPLERRERLEQLRALEAGMRIDAIRVDDVPFGVDTPHDLERARAIIATWSALRGKARLEEAVTKTISFQGEPGANSHIACDEACPGWKPLPCPTFEDAFAAIQEGQAELGMIPIENSIAGRVADIHHLLPTSGLHIVGEHFLPIHFQLMALPRPISARSAACTATSTRSASAARSSAGSA